MVVYLAALFFFFPPAGFLYASHPGKSKFLLNSRTLHESKLICMLKIRKDFDMTKTYGLQHSESPTY